MEDLSQGALGCRRRGGLPSAWRCSRAALVRYLVLFVIDLKTRRVHIAGVTCAADSAWMAQVARNLTDAAAGPFVRSIKHEGLRHIVPLGEGHLSAVVREFVEHYHAERNHQGLGNVIPFPSRDSVSPVGRIGRRQRLGGVLSFYERNAA